MKETKTFYSSRIVLKRACITAFRPLSDSIQSIEVECEIEERPFDTVYEVKVIQTSTQRPDIRHAYFTQVLRKKAQ